MKQRRVGPFQVSAIGLGSMNLSHAYGAPPSFEEASALLHRALVLGCTLFDTATLDGFGANGELIGEVLAPHRSKFTLASKCGIQGVRFADGNRVVDGRSATLKATCEAFVAFSPVARGFLTGTLLGVSGFGAKDTSAAPCRASRPQRMPAWLLARGEHVISIPGTTHIDHLEENLGADAVVLEPALMQRLDALINQRTVLATGPAPASSWRLKRCCRPRRSRRSD